MNTVVVSRHKTFIEHLRNIGLIDDNTKIITHVEDIEDIRGKHVIGMLPLHLAAVTERITFVPLNLSLEQRERENKTGKELPLSEIEAAAGEPSIYFVEDAITNESREVKLNGIKHDMLWLIRQLGNFLIHDEKYYREYMSNYDWVMGYETDSKGE